MEDSKSVPHFSCKNRVQTRDQKSYLKYREIFVRSSSGLIFPSTNPQYDNRLFIELQVQYMKNPS